MSVQFPKLPFLLDALEPHISKKTLDFHYNKHHKNYVDTLNRLISGTSLDSASLEEIIILSIGNNSKIYHNAAQAWNHSFMWNGLKNSSEKPSQNLESVLSKNFGSLNNFQNEFNQKAKEHFGSGWTWLVKNKKGQLQIYSLDNADNPNIKDDIPLLTCDVWEHAYYLDYQNERPKYLEHYWSLINWAQMEINLEHNTNSGPL